MCGAVTKSSTLHYIVVCRAVVDIVVGQSSSAGPDWLGGELEYNDLCIEVSGEQM